MKKLSVLFILFVIMTNTLAQSPNWLWAKSAGGTVHDASSAVTTDKYGNIYVAGNFQSSSVTFGSITLSNAGTNNDIFLVKYDVNGNLIWAVKAGGTNDDGVTSLTVGASGNIYMTGIFESSILSFGTTTLTNAGSRDIFIAKYDASGNAIWAKSHGGISDEYASSLATDASGNVYVTGFFYSTTFVADTTTLTSAGGNDIFLVKYDANGNILWAKGSGGSLGEAPNSVAIDSSGNVYIAGYFYSSPFTFGTITLTNPNNFNKDFFLLKYDANGNPLWAKSAGGTNDDIANSITTDAVGNVYLVGNFYYETLTIGTTVLTNAGSSDIFLVKYDASGNITWAVKAGGTGGEQARSIAKDASGNIYVTGSFGSPTLMFGSTTLVNGGGSEIFLAKYNASENVLWAISASGTSSELAYSVATDDLGNIYIAGAYSSPVLTFGSTTLTNAVNTGNFYDMFIVSFNGVVGVSENISDAEDVIIYPNPSNGKIKVKSEKLKVESIEVYNLFGEKIYSNPAFNKQTSNDIDLSGFPKGIYFIQVISENEMIANEKIVIQ